MRVSNPAPPNRKEKGRMLPTRNLLIGYIRYKLGECPRCNSDAPALYDCPVCEFNYVPREYWWIRFKDWREGKEMPTFFPQWVIDYKAKEAADGEKQD